MPYPNREVLWNHIQRHHGSSWKLNVTDLESSLAKEKHASDRNWVVAQLKTFADFKLGRFFNGRRGHDSRIEWKREPSKLLLPDLPKDSLTPAPIPVLEHLLPLRVNVVAKLSAPQDLTRSEADRLIEFIRLLPIEPPTGLRN